jgi:hypothetical protein
MSTMSVWALARFAFYALFGLSVPQSVVVLGLALPYSRCVRPRSSLIPYHG